MRILLAAGIYPPEVGGPARYAVELERFWEKDGDVVRVAVASRFQWLPGIFRKIAFLKWCMLKGFATDVVISLDTFSAALPAYYAARFLRKPFVVRAGGDFLWEMYVERTKKDVTLRTFCERLPDDLSFKERTVLRSIKKIFHGADVVIFSTAWYEELARKAYGPFRSSVIVENPTGPREEGKGAEKKTFVLAGRNLYLKNTHRFRAAFAVARKPENTELVSGNMSRERYLEILRSAYAVAVPSLSEVSPNTALDAIRFGKPLILTKECGYSGRFGAAARLVDPLSDVSLKEAIEYVLDPDRYEEMKRAAETHPCERTFEAVAREIRGTLKALCASS